MRNPRLVIEERCDHGMLGSHFGRIDCRGGNRTVLDPELPPGFYKAVPVYRTSRLGREYAVTDDPTEADAWLIVLEDS